MTLAARLARQTGAAIALARCERLAAGAGFALHVFPLAEPLPAELDSQAGQVQAATVINRGMEQLVHAMPGQYLWGYHRYKSPRRLKPEDA
jgi:KDO2-lipid IV(A) lauroyltransferase